MYRIITDKERYVVLPEKKKKQSFYRISASLEVTDGRTEVRTNQTLLKLQYDYNIDDVFLVQSVSSCSASIYMTTAPPV